MVQPNARSTQYSDKDLAAQVATVLKLSIPSLLARQNQIRGMLGEDPTWHQRDIAKLGAEDRKKLVQLVSGILTTQERLIGEKSQQTGLAKPRVWRIVDEISKVEAGITLSVSLRSRTVPPSPMDKALGLTAARSEQHLFIEGTDIGIWDDKAGLTPADIAGATRISMRSGRTIFLLTTPAPFLLNASTPPALLGGFEVGKGVYELTAAGLRGLERRSEPKTIYLPTLGSELQLEGYTKRTLVTNNAWSGAVVPPRSPAYTAVISLLPLNDLFEGLPTERRFALHEVSLYLNRMSRGLSDGKNFIPLERPTNFGNDDRMIRALAAVSEDRWPDLIRALHLCFPETILPSGLIDSSKDEVRELLKGISEESSPREAANTGCFHGYPGVEVGIPEGSRHGYLVFELPRPKADPVYVVDTAEVRAGYIFTNKADAVALATETISVREAGELATARIVHRGVEADWMARFDEALAQLGVVKNP